MAHITTLTRAHTDIYNSNANTYSYSGSFETFKETEVIVKLDGIALTYQSGTINESASPREYTVNLTDKTVHIGGANLSSGTISIYPVTDLGAPTLKAPYTAGSAITASDLTNNQLQVMRRQMEFDENKLDSTGGTLTGDLSLGQNAKIIFEGATDDAYETTLTVTDPTADRTVTLPNITGTVVTTGDTGSVATGMIAADAITGAKIADDAINSEHYTDGSIDTAHIADANVTTAKIADDAVTADKLANTSVTAASYTAADITVDAQGRITAASSGAIATSEITDGAVTTAKLGADAVTGAKIADDAVDSEHLAADSIDAEHYAPGSVDTTALGADAVTGAKIADDAVDSEHLAADSIDAEHYAAASVDATALASNAVTTGKITDANVTTDKLAADSVTIAKIGCEQTTISDSDSHIPTSGAVVDYVAAQLAPIGGLEVIADDESFPNTIPSAGVVISISDAAGLQVNSSGVSTNADTLDNSTVTINGFPSELRGGVGSNPDPYVFQSGAGLMVQSTGSSHTYNYHQAMIRESDFVQLSDDINDFNNRYRVNAGEPGSNNDEGDLVFDTNANKMKVYDGSSWGEVTSTGDFKYLFLCPAGGSGSPTLDGSIATYDLRESSNSGSAASVSSAAQLVVSVNGVVQKANTGTSAPSEGFALVDANTIVFGANLASGDSVFIVQIGSAVSIPTPGDGTVSAAKIASGAVTTVKIADANVTTAKIADDAVTAAKLASDAVVTASIVDANVTTAKIAGDAITGAKIADDAIDSEHYTDGSIDTAHIADAQITTAKITDANVTTAKIAADAVTAAKIADDAVGAEHIEQLDADLSFADSAKAKFGAGNDLQIYHDGSDSIINDTGTGSLVLLSNDVQILNTAQNEYMIRAIENGAVELYHDNSKKIETTSAGVTVTGTVTDTKGELRTIPQLSKSSQHTIVSSDAGKHSINSSGGWVFNTSTGFTAGQAITLINNSGSDQTIDFSAVSAYNTADAATGSRTLAGRGMATVICTAANTYYISGSGLS